MQFDPNHKGLPQLYKELEALTVFGYETAEERQRRARAAVTFQSCLRVKRALKAFRDKKAKRIMHDSATTINAGSRGFLGRKKSMVLREKRTEERKFAKRAHDLMVAERLMQQCFDTDDEDDEVTPQPTRKSGKTPQPQPQQPKKAVKVSEKERLKRLRQANRAYRRLIRALPPAAVAHLAANKRSGGLFAHVMKGVMGARAYGKVLKIYRKQREKGEGGWASLDEDIGKPDPTAALRARIWQLESDVSSLLLVDARRRLADRRQTLIAQNQGRPVTPHMAYAMDAAQPSPSRGSSASGGSRGAAYLTSPMPQYSPPPGSETFESFASSVSPPPQQHEASSNAFCATSCPTALDTLI